MIINILLGALYSIDPIVTVAPSTFELDTGQRIYFSHCISCHHKNPTLKGVIGPEIQHVPYEVFEVKVLTGNYPKDLPAGFTPKRKTKLMKPLPKLKDDIKVLYAWIKFMKKS